MKTTRVVAIAALCFLPILVIAEDRPYSLGPVTSVSYIRVKPGQYDNYMRYLAGPYRKQLEANVKAGLVVSWKVFDASPRNDKEPNVILTTTYPNMATLDKQKEFDDIASQVHGTFSTMDKGFADRGTMRDVLGGELIREVVLK
jgi:hypothetical protein